MRHTITLSGNSEIKSQRIQCKKLPNIQQESIVKIQQNNNKVYAIYTPIQTSQRSQVSIKYLSLNKMEESLALITKIQTPLKIKSIEIQLSPIDYQLVNNNFGLLQKQFLDQVNIVWPGAKIPLHYDECNYIILMPKVNEINLVDPYAAISFSMINQNQNSKNKERQENNLNDLCQLGQKVLILSKLNEEKGEYFGYDNKLYLSNEQFEYLKKFKINNQNNIVLCTIQPLLQFVSNPTFQEFQQFKKLQESHKTSQLKPILVQLLPSSSNPFKQWQGISPSTVCRLNIESQSHEIYFSCSYVCKKSLCLPQKLMINDETLNQFEVSETLSLQMFLKEIQSKKYQISIQAIDIKNKNKEYQSLVINKFARKFSQSILSDKQFIFLQNYYPFLIDNQVYGLILQKKSSKANNYQPMKNFLLIKNNSDNKINKKVQDNNNEQIQKITNIIAKHIIINQNIEDQKVEKWLPIIKYLSQKRKTLYKINQDDIFQKIFEFCYKKQLKQTIRYLKNQMPKNNSSKILFSTYSSNGKTFLHQYLSLFQNRIFQSQHQLSLQSWYLDCRTLIHLNNKFEEIKDYLTCFISICPYKLIFFDNIQMLVPLIEQGDQMRQKQKYISHVFGNVINKLLQINNKIGIFTTKSQANIDPIMRFGKIIKLKNPNRQTRNQIINELKLNLQKNWSNEFVDKTQSFSLGSFNNYLIAQQIPIKKQSKRKNDFSKIVGLAQAKRMIQSVIQKPNKYGFIYDKVKIKVPRGILLYGATGNGKTALGSAVEDQFPMKFFTVKGSDILSKYIGGSEAAVRQVFEKALSVSPSIIFFDEFQSIVPRRNSSGTGVTDRVVNQFLCYLDGVSSTTGVFIIAASSRPDLIDPALLRPGRIDSHIYLDYPTSEQKFQLLKMFENSIKLQVSDEQFMEATMNFSYSDLIGLLKELRIKKSSQVLKQKENPQVQDFKFIHKQLFNQTVNGYRIGTDISQQIKQKDLYERFKCGKGPQIKKQKFIQM